MKNKKSQYTIWSTTIRKKLKEEETYQLIKDSLDPYDKNLIVTPKDIDETIENLAIIISEGLNRSLHPGRI